LKNTRKGALTKLSTLDHGSKEVFNIEYTVYTYSYVDTVNAFT
jgi:hypothetical protein